LINEATVLRISTEQTMKIKCIFCLTEQESSDEHVVPESIGGALVVREVCKPCNNNLNTAIDDPFSQSAFVQMGRFAHQVGGKRGNLPNPFARPGETVDKRKMKLSKELEPYLIRHVEETVRGDQIELRIEIDAKDEERLDAMIRAPLSSALSRTMIGASAEQIAREVEGAIEQAKQRAVRRSERPEIKYRFCVAYDDLRFEYLKIAYEMAFKLFGYDWIDKCKTASAIRAAILQRDQKAQVHGSIPCEDFLKNISDDADTHYLLMLHNMCYIKLFGLAGAVSFADGDSRFLIPEDKGKLFVLDYIKVCCREQNFIDVVARQAGG
jgi:hypothetical protein